VYTQKLSKVHVNVSKSLKVLLSNVVVQVSVKLIPCVKCLMALVWKEHSHCIHHVWHKLMLFVKGKYVVRNCTTCVTFTEKQLVSKKLEDKIFLNCLFRYRLAKTLVYQGFFCYVFRPS